MLPKIKFQMADMFYTIQGEAFYAGYPSVFIRLAVCNLKCSWCDTDFKLRDTKTLEELLEEVETMLPENMEGMIFVISGGEPTLQDYPALVTALNHKYPDNTVTMESNGRDASSDKMHKLREDYNFFLTCSPKIAVEDCMPYFKDPMWQGDELKIVLDPAFTEQQLSMLRSLPKQLGKRFQHYYIQPCSEDFAPATNFVKENPQWRLSLQTHKILLIE